MKTVSGLVSQGRQASIENGTSPFVDHLRGPPEGGVPFFHTFTLPVCLGPKYTLGRASEMTPEGRCTVFSAGLDSLGGQYGTPFSPGNPQKVLQKGVPPKKIKGLLNKGSASFFGMFLTR